MAQCKKCGAQCRMESGQKWDPAKRVYKAAVRIECPACKDSLVVIGSRKDAESAWEAAQEAMNREVQ